MYAHNDILIALIDYLKAAGYPPESLAIEYIIGRHHADLAVIDPDTAEPIALFEIKQERSVNSEINGRKQLELLLDNLPVKSTPAYLVFPRDGSPPFEVTQVRSPQMDKADIQPAESLLSYDILRNSGRNAILIKTKQDRERTFDLFKYVCWGIALAVVVLLILDATKALVLSPVQLTLSGIVIALVLIPFASKLRILGVEFERLKDEDRIKK